MDEKTLNSTDVDLGERIKRRRKSLSISQQKLGEVLGVSFQQIQKYEKGINRISASSLKVISEFLDMKPQYFYDSPAENDLTKRGFAESGDGFDVVKMLRDPELKELSRAFASIDDVKVRKTILDLVRSLSPKKQD